jgi:hypothetical protein
MCDETWTYAKRDRITRPLPGQGAEMGRFMLGSTVVMLWPQWQAAGSAMGG